jgi:hypothetical protein
MMYLYLMRLHLFNISGRRLGIVVRNFIITFNANGCSPQHTHSRLSLLQALAVKLL